MRSAQRKVKGGKLVRVKVDDDGARITRVSLTGDFFVHPEEGLEALEGAFVGAPLDAGAEELLARLNEAIGLAGLEIVGFEPRDLAELVAEASS